MLRLLPYLIALAVGPWLAALLAAHLDPGTTLYLAATLGGISAVATGLAQKIEGTLADFERVDLSSPVLVARLRERVDRRRARLLWKRSATYVASVVTIIAAGLGASQTDPAALDTLRLLGVTGAWLAMTGTLLLYAEASRLERALSDIRHYTNRLATARAEADKLRTRR